MMRLPGGERLWLALIVLAGAALRTYVWFNGYAQYGVHGVVRHGDGYLEMAQAIGRGNSADVLAHWRGYQFVYPVYLSPIFLFGLDDSTYVFWLHHLLAASTTCLMFAVAGELFGRTAGLLAAFAYAMHLHIAYWFNWTLADTAFHFQLALCLWAVARCWTRTTARRLLAVAAALFLMCFTRPEAFVLSAGFVTSLVFRALSARIGPWKTAATVTVLVIAASGVGILAVARSKPLRERVLSNVDIAWGFYYGSQRTPTTAAAVDAMLIEMRVYGARMAAADPERRSPWYWNSLAGIERIRQRPLHYLGYWSERLVNALIPSLFREGVSLRYKVFDRAMALFLIVGAVLGLAATRKTRSPAPNLVFSAFCVYCLVAFIQSEWDVRVQLSPHVLLLPGAAYGWLWAAGQGVARADTPVRPQPQCS